MRMERDSRKIVKRLLEDGFVLVAIKGSHHKFRKDGTTVATDLDTSSPLAFTKRTESGVLVRHFNGDRPTVEAWTEHR